MMPESFRHHYACFILRRYVAEPKRSLKAEPSDVFMRDLMDSVLCVVGSEPGTVLTPLARLADHADLQRGVIILPFSLAFVPGSSGDRRRPGHHQPFKETGCAPSGPEKTALYHVPRSGNAGYDGLTWPNPQDELKDQARW